MNKLKLEMDELGVESFATVPADPEKGTVIAYVTVTNCTSEEGEYTIDYPLSCDRLCGSYYCTGNYSCGYTWCTCPDYGC